MNRYRLLTTLLLLSFGSALPIPLLPDSCIQAQETESPQATGMDVKSVQYKSLNGDNIVIGGFFKLSDGSWIEQNAEGTFHFQEVSRDQNSVNLRKSDGASVVLNLATARIILNEGIELYVIERSFKEAVIVGHNLLSVECAPLGSSDLSNGISFTKSGNGQWFIAQRSPGVADKISTAQEVGRDEWSVYLTGDDGQSYRLDLYLKKIIVGSTEAWSVIHPYSELTGDQFVNVDQGRFLRISNLRVNNSVLPELTTTSANISISFDYEVYYADSDQNPIPDQCIAFYWGTLNKRVDSRNLIAFQYGPQSGSYSFSTPWPRDNFGEIPELSYYLISVRTNHEITAVRQGALAMDTRPGIKTDPTLVQKIKIANFRRPVK